MPQFATGGPCAKAGAEAMRVDASLISIFAKFRRLP